MVGYSPAHAEMAEALGATSVEVLEMNLEDAFIAYTPRDAAAANDRVGGRPMIAALVRKEIRRVAGQLVWRSAAFWWPAPPACCPSRSIFLPIRIPFPSTIRSMTAGRSFG